MRKHYNGLKTAALFGVLWAVLLALGALIGTSTRSSAPIWIMAWWGWPPQRMATGTATRSPSGPCRPFL